VVFQTDPVVAGYTLTPLLIQQILAIGLGSIAAVVMIVLFVRMRRTMKRDQRVATAQAEVDRALRKLRGQLGYAAQLLNGERDKMSYDRLRYRDADASHLAKLINQAEANYRESQNTLDKAVRSLPNVPDEHDYRELGKAVESIVPTIAPIETLLQQAISYRSTLEQQLTQFSQAIDQAKQAQLTLSQRLTTLGISQRAMLQKADSRLKAASEALETHTYEQIGPNTQLALEGYQHINRLLNTMFELRTSIKTGRTAAEKAAMQGFDVSASLEGFQQALSLLDKALAAMMGGQIDVGEQLIAQSESMRKEAVMSGGNTPQQQQRNNELLTLLQQQGAHLSQQQAATYEIFLGVVHAHPSMWLDLVQVGSEASVHLRYSYYYTQLALRRNAPSTSNSTLTAQTIHLANQSMQRAQTLWQIIEQRQEIIDSIQKLAREEYIEVEESYDRALILFATGTSTTNADHEDLKNAFNALQQMIDEVPFDAQTCYQRARTLHHALFDYVPIESSQVAFVLAKRVTRMREMLTRQVTLLEQFSALYHQALPVQIARGIQSIRLEATAFETSLYTASNLTVPIVPELQKLMQRYERLNNAIQHITQQLPTLRLKLLQDLEQIHGLCQTALKYLSLTADDTVIQIAITRLYEINDQWLTGTIDMRTAQKMVATIATDLDPNQNMVARDIEYPYLALRAWGKAGLVAPSDEIPWLPIRTPHPHW
jgi:hypothetical protein